MFLSYVYMHINVNLYYITSITWVQKSENKKKKDNFKHVGGVEVQAGLTNFPLVGDSTPTPL